MLIFNVKNTIHLLKNPKNLTEKQAEQLIELKKLDLKTARAYQIKLALQFSCSFTQRFFSPFPQLWLHP